MAVIDQDVGQHVRGRTMFGMSVASITLINRIPVGMSTASRSPCVCSDPMVNLQLGSGLGCSKTLTC